MVRESWFSVGIEAAVRYRRVDGIVRKQLARGLIL